LATILLPQELNVIETHYPKRFKLLHNMSSLETEAKERDKGVEPYRLLAQNQALYLPAGSPSLASYDHLRLLAGRMLKQRNEMVTILGSKALAGIFDVMSIVRENLEEYLLAYPGPPSEIQI
jgi:hypothetical protein